MTAAAAFRHILAAARAELAGHEQDAAAGGMEGVHQMRVALRRMRAALKLFRGLLRPGAISGLNAQARAVAGVLGAARDLDVLVEERFPQIQGGVRGPRWLALIRRRAQARRRTAHQGVARGLAGPEYRALLAAIDTWIGMTDGELALLGAPGLLRPLGEAAPELLARLYRRVRKRHAALGGPIGAAAHGPLHELRKSIKVLRYGADFLSPCFPRAESKPLIKAAKHLQELLGAVTDADVATHMIDDLAADGAVHDEAARARFRAWNAEAGGAARAALADAWAGFAAVPRFWKGPSRDGGRDGGRDEGRGAGSA